MNANVLMPSILRAGLDPAKLVKRAELNMAGEAKAWRDVWSAGQGGALSPTSRRRPNAAPAAGL